MLTQLRDNSALTAKNGSKLKGEQPGHHMLVPNLQAMAAKKSKERQNGEKYPTLRLIDSAEGNAEEEEFDPNELKLLPVLATDRH